MISFVSIKIIIKLFCLVMSDLMESLTNDNGDGNENGKKANWFRLEKQQLCTCIMLLFVLDTILSNQLQKNSQQ